MPITEVASSTTTLFPVLAATERSPEIPESSDAYGWLVGSWNLNCDYYAGTPVAIEGQAHFAWVLEGRAVQDVWIMPRRTNRNANTPKTNNMYGTTLRVWEPAIDAWRITWTNPVRGHREEQIGRRVGKEIVQIGARGQTPTRWRFTEITKDSFLWIGEVLEPDGVTWKLEGRFRASRIH